VTFIWDVAVAALTGPWSDRDTVGVS
jgi:hypothetical protein